MTYFETSCKTGENVSDLFEQIASDLVRQHDPKKVPHLSLIFSISFFSFTLAPTPST